MPGIDVLSVGARFRKIESAVTPIPFDSGNVRTQEIPRSFLYKGIVIRLSGSVTIGTANVTTAASENPLALIQKIEIVADGRKMLVSLSARDLFRHAHIFNGKAPELVTPTLTTAASPAAFAATIPISFEALRMISPVDSFFDPRSYEKVELRITWGTANSMASAVGTAVLAIAAGCQATVHAIQTVEGADMVLFNRLQTYDETSVTASSQNLAVNVPRSGLLGGILLRTDRDLVTVDNIINYVTLRSDNAYNHVDRLDWATIQRRNIFDYQIDGVSNNGALSGYAFIDLTEDGQISSALNTYDLQTIQLIFDVTRTSGTELIRASYVFFEPLANI